MILTTHIGHVEPDSTPDEAHPLAIAERTRHFVDIRRARVGGASVTYPSDDSAVGLAMQAAIDHGQWVYVAVDGVGRVLSALLPMNDRVDAIDTTRTGDLSVTFEGAPSRYLLSRQHHAFATIADALHGSLAARTFVSFFEVPGYEAVLEVRPAPTPLLIEGPPAELLDAFDFSTLTALSTAEAGEVFGRLNALACFQGDTEPDCIPFRLVGVSCQHRAHEMRRRMEGWTVPVIGAKLWLFGERAVKTVNSRNCFVTWGFHVAPVVYAPTGAGNADVRVIDPSLHERDVSVAEWIARQTTREIGPILDGSDPCMACQITGARGYLLKRGWTHSISDDDYADTRMRLAAARTMLQNTFALHHGQPPYRHCDASLMPNDTIARWLQLAGVGRAAAHTSE